MRARTRRALALVAVAGVISACQRDAAPAASQAGRRAKLDLSDPVDSVTGVVASCEFAKTDANQDPRLLLSELVRRGAAGEFLHTEDWFATATDCPGHAQGWEAYDVVASWTVSSTVLRDSAGLAIVTYRRLGRFGEPDDPSRQGAPASLFRLDTGTVADTLVLRRTPFGWRIAGRTPPHRVSYQAAFARGDLKAVDTLRLVDVIAAWK